MEFPENLLLTLIGELYVKNRLLQESVSQPEPEPKEEEPKGGEKK